MSEFRRVKSEVFEGGEKQLRKVIETVRSINATPVERSFDAKWALDLKERILNGHAVTFLWAVAKLSRGGRIVDLRVNGQHSSWALQELLNEGNLPDGLAVHLDTYSVSDEDGAVMLFRQFDARKSSRSKEDISGAYQCFHESLRNVHRGVARFAVEGVIWYRREVQEAPVPSGDDVYKLFNEERLHPFFLQMDATLRDGKANELKRVPVMAAAYGTWIDDAKQSAEFWRLAALGSKRTEEDAASDLDAEMLRLKETKEKVNARDLYAKCHKAWDAFGKHIRVGNFKVNTRTKGLPVIAA
jgi:hypothetical protein